MKNIRQRDVNPDNFTTSSSSSLSLSSSGGRRQMHQKFSPNFSPEFEEEYEDTRQMPKYSPNFSPEYQENEGGGRRRRLSLMPPAPIAPSSIRDSDNTSIIKQKINSKPLTGEEYEEYLTTKKVNYISTFLKPC